MPTTVRAHARRGTRGVRRHLRIVPNTSRFVPEVRLYPFLPEGQNDPLGRLLYEYELRADNTVAFTHMRPEKNAREMGLDPNAIYIVRDSPSKAFPISDVLSHEELHHILQHEVDHPTSLALDNIMNVNKLRRAGNRHRGGIPEKP